MKQQQTRWAFLGGVLALGLIAPVLLASTPSTPSDASDASTSVALGEGGTHVDITAHGRTFTLTPDDFQARVLDAVNCQEARLEPEQTLTGTRFFPSVAVDAQTGNVAVGVLLQECYETQVSAVFVVDPQPSGYSLHRVPVSGPHPLPDEVSTYPLNSIVGLGYLNRELLIQQGDASGSSALLVYSTTGDPAGVYRGCVYTEAGEGQRLCP